MRVLDEFQVEVPPTTPMATDTKFKLDGNSDASTPPSYHLHEVPISESLLELPKPLQSKRSWMLSDKKRARATASVLSCIRDLVTAKDFTPSSVTKIVDACAAALPCEEFLNLLQSLNIDGHTALFWAILNGRLEALWAFMKFVPKWSYICSSDLRLACMAINNNALFTQLNLRRTIGADDAPLRRSLGYPPDDVEVQLEEGGGLEKHMYVALVRFKMYQKRLYILQDVSTEFVAAGRIWWLRIHMGPQGRWRVIWGLSECSLPVRLESSKVFIRRHEGKPGSAIGKDEPKQFDLATEYTGSVLLAPQKNSITNVELVAALSAEVGDWPMDPNTVYLDCDGTLEMELIMMLL